VHCAAGGVKTQGRLLRSLRFSKQGGQRSKRELCQLVKFLLYIAPTNLPLLDTGRVPGVFNVGEL
jgi:hypothetical protein